MDKKIIYIVISFDWLIAVKMEILIVNLTKVKEDDFKKL